MKRAISILKKYWGYDRFLPNQETVIRDILEKKDTVALIPTGGGKSMCYQLPALIMEGTCIVISPLIALIDDQIQRLKSLNIPAEGLHSGFDKNRQNIVMRKLENAELKLLYISPEKLQSDSFRNLLRTIKLSYISVDEAHCISQWGYDFRPQYQKIANIKELFPHIHISAFTATANNKILDDIIKYLELDNPSITRGSFLKENITFAVIETEKKLKVLILLLKEFSGSGIIYMRSRKGTVFLADYLAKNGENVMYYHAGMDSSERHKVQLQWLNNEIRTIISTTAFGMGIDKSDVRFVLHFDLPTSIEEYYQEAGRAGRDGKISNAVILYNKNDLNVLHKNNIDTFPRLKDIRTTYYNLLKYLDIDISNKYNISKKIDLYDFFKFNGIDRFKSYKCIGELERYGLIILNIPIRNIHSELKINFEEGFLEKMKNTDETAYLIFKEVILNYEAVFITLTSISEEKISKITNIDEKEIIEVFENYKKKKYIDYKRQKSDFNISFVNKDFALINEDELIFRKERLENNISSIFDYLAYSNCRQKYILTYFGEKLKKPCNICDICQGVYDVNYSRNQLELFTQRIDDLIFDNNTGIDDLAYADTFLNRNKNIQMLKLLFKKKKLKTMGNKIIKSKRDE